jgi:hypothetical protein
MTMIFRIAAILCLALSAAPAAAQEVSPPPIAEPVEDEGLAVTVTDETPWQDLGIAIPSFATDREQPTPANSQGTGALAQQWPVPPGRPGLAAAAELSADYRACLRHLARAQRPDAGPRLRPRRGRWPPDGRLLSL